MIKCPDCRKNSPDGSERCVHCGYSEDPFKKKDVQIIWYKPSGSSRKKSNAAFEKRGGVGDGTTATFPDKHGNRPAGLIDCPCCGKQVSSRARSCPSCGHPIDTTLSCPKCGSTDVRPITGLDKGVSAYAFGIFSANTITNNYRCRKCRFKF